MHVSTLLKNKEKLLCILHYSPPVHGASKVGDIIKRSDRLKDKFECRFIKIKSSVIMGDIGKVSLKKIYFIVELYVKVFLALVTFRPQKIYFTANIKGVAFYRDLLISMLWKIYGFCKSVDVFYHYHMKGVNSFVSLSDLNLKLTRYFIKDINLILLSYLLEKDFKKIQTYNKILFLPNGVDNTIKNRDFEGYIESKYAKVLPLEVLYLSNMIKSKGYFNVLKLANKTKDQAIRYHFAGNWTNSKDEKEFFDYIARNRLAKNVIFHGFVDGKQKQELLIKAHLFIFPTRYENEAFPLTILEALSNGIPVISTNEGSIPIILDKESGIVLDSITDLADGLTKAKSKFINKKTAMYCRKRYLENFTIEIFESKLINIFK